MILLTISLMSISVIQSTDSNRNSNNETIISEIVNNLTGYQIYDGSVNTTNLCPNAPCSGGW